MSGLSVEAFMAGAAHVDPSAGVTGNTDWAVSLAGELRGIVAAAADAAPRSQQIHLGPSELGTGCDRQVVGKLLGTPATNHIVDPWPSVVGTALHAWLADAIDSQVPPERGWLTESRVYPNHAINPLEDYSGTADVYAYDRRAIIDHKCLGKSTHDKLRRHGPSRVYRAQVWLYALGCERMGFPVERVAIAAWPRTGSSLSGLYVWHEERSAETDALVAEVLEVDMPRRQGFARHVTEGRLSLRQVPTTTDRDECYWCPFLRPDSANDPSLPGCPGATP